MYWILVSLIIILIIFFLARKVKVNSMPLLSVRIDTIDGFKFYAKFSPLHNEIKSIEYVRLNLHFIAKMLLLAKRDEKSLIRLLLHNIAKNKNLEAALDEFKQEVFILSESDQFPDKSSSIVAILYYQNMQSRKIATKIPWGIIEDQFFGSIVTLLTISVQELDDYQKNILHVGIQNLSHFYNLNLRNNSVKSSHLIPNKAFNEAVVSS